MKIKRLREQYAVDRASFESRGQFPNQAGILVPVTDDPAHPEIILTKRAEHLSTHSGEVSFPGGKWEPEDPSLVATALRESEEEIALPPERVEVINVQPHIYSLWGIKVTPFVGLIPADIPLKPDPNELDAVFRVPVDYFLADRRVHTHIFGDEEPFWAPVYDFDGFRIWGLTARVLVQFLNRAFDAGIEREHSAPEVIRKRRNRPAV